MLPTRYLDQSLTYLNGIIQLGFASLISIHAVANFENALMIYSAPISLVGWAIGSAAFPHFSRQLAKKRQDLFKRDFLLVLRMIVWLSLPIVVLGYFGRDYLARAISPRDSSEIALIFAILSLGITFRMIYVILIRFYYAQKDIWSPLKATFASLTLNFFLAWWLSRLFQVAGLAWAAVLAVLLEVSVLLTIMVRRDRNLFNRRFCASLTPLLMAAGLLALWAIFVRQFLTFSNLDSAVVILIKLGIFGLLGLGAYLLISWFLNIAEARQVVKQSQKYLARLRK